MRVKEVDIRDRITIADKHHPMMQKEVVAESIDLDERRRKTQFPESRQHC